MLKMVKIAIGSVISIFLADMMGLSYSTSAGIITLLTIQDTSRETIAISAKRIGAFLVAAVLSYVVFQFFGYHVFSYGVSCSFLSPVVIRSVWEVQFPPMRYLPRIICWNRRWRSHRSAMRRCFC